MTDGGSSVYLDARTLPGDLVTVIGIDWQQRRPFLQFSAGNDERIQQIALDEGTRLEFHIEELSARCVGRVELASVEQTWRLACADGATAFPQCRPCGHVEGFQACVRCDGYECPSLPPRQAAYCTSLHWLYLADFGPGWLKAGVASASRRDARLDEQGPRSAYLFGPGAGPEMKRLESRLHKLGYAPSLNHGRKRNLLQVPPVDNGTHETAVKEALRVASTLSELLTTELVEYVPPPRSASLRALAAGAEHLQPEAGRSYSLNVLGAVGTVLVVEDSVGYAVLDAWSLRGARVRQGVENPASRSVQESLL